MEELSTVMDNTGVCSNQTKTLLVKVEIDIEDRFAPCSCWTAYFLENKQKPVFIVDQTDEERLRSTKLERQIKIGDYDIKFRCRLI